MLCCRSEHRPVVTAIDRIRQHLHVVVILHRQHTGIVWKTAQRKTYGWLPEARLTRKVWPGIEIHSIPGFLWDVANACIITVTSGTGRCFQNSSVKSCGHHTRRLFRPAGSRVLSVAGSVNPEPWRSLSIAGLKMMYQDSSRNSPHGGRFIGFHLLNPG